MSVIIKLIRSINLKKNLCKILLLNENIPWIHVQYNSQALKNMFLTKIKTTKQIND